MWMASTRPDVVIDNAAGTATFTFEYGQDAENVTLTAFLRTNRDSADAEDELFRLEATSDPAATTATAGTPTTAKRGGGAATSTHPDKTVRIIDQQTQTYVVTFPGTNNMTINEGGVAALEFEAVPDRTVDLPFNVTLSSPMDVSDYSLVGDPPGVAISEDYRLTAVTPDTRTTVTATEPFTISASTDDGNDGDRVDDVVTATVQTIGQIGNQRTFATFLLTVLDQHMLPAIRITKMTIPNPAGTGPAVEVQSIPEGMVGTVTLTADRSPSNVPDTEKVTVTLSHVEAGSTADANDYTLPSPPRVVIAGSATNNMMTKTFTIDVDADEDVGDESVVLGAMVEGDATRGRGPNGSTDVPHQKLAAIPFTDVTATQITAKTYPEIEKARDDARMAGAGANGLWEPGETLTLMAADLFLYADTANVVLGSVVVEDPAVLSASASGDMVTVTAMGDGESPLSITGTVVPMSSLEVTQNNATTVTVKFPIMVDAHMITAKEDAQAMADAAVMKAAADSAHGVWEPSPNGATAMIALSDLFDVPASIEPRYLAESSTAMVGAEINDSMMMVELEPMAAGMAMITVTAVDIADGPGQGVSVNFNVEVMAGQAVRAMSQAAVDLVFMDAGAGSLHGGWRRGHGRHEHALRGRRRGDAQLLGHVGHAGRAERERQRHDVDPYADVGRERHDHGGGD